MAADAKLIEAIDNYLDANPNEANAKELLDRIGVAGWQLCPKEPNEAMVQAGLEELRTHLGHGGVIVRDVVFCYRAMIAAR